MYCTDNYALQKLLIDKDIRTKTKFAEICNIDRNTAGKILNGQEQPSALAMYRIAEGLKLSPIQAGTIFFSYNLRNA